MAGTFSFIRRLSCHHRFSSLSAPDLDTRGQTSPIIIAPGRTCRPGSCPMRRRKRCVRQQRVDTDAYDAHVYGLEPSVDVAAHIRRTFSTLLSPLSSSFHVDPGHHRPEHPLKPRSSTSYPRHPTSRPPSRPRIINPTTHTPCESHTSRC